MKRVLLLSLGASFASVLSAQSNIVAGLDGRLEILDNITYSLDASTELYARGENLLDEDYEEVFGYRAPGIGGYVGMRYKLQ